MIRTKSSLKTPKSTYWAYSTRLHVILYSTLLIATPFVMLQNFLQDAIGRLSRLSINIVGVDVPVVPVTALIIAITLIAIFRSRITGLRVVAGVSAILLITIAQQFTDYYFDHKFYDLQQNWHYIAYCIFAFMIYRDISYRKISPSKIMLITFLSAMLFSSIDEVFQKFMSSRIFDISDIAKDVWGALIGITMLYIGGRSTDSIKKDLKRIRQPSLKGYIKYPLSMLILLYVFSLIFLISSSLLTDFPYLFPAILITIGGFILFFMLFQISQFKWGKYTLLFLIAILILGQSFLFLKFKSRNITYHQYGLTVYKGIPIPFFDIMIFPDGSFRLVDKKHFFNYRDQAFFIKQGTDIILIGSGDHGKSGHGFPEETEVQFVYNSVIKRGTQVIILKNSEACELFNKLKREKKNVLFILHNTC